MRNKYNTQAGIAQYVALVVVGALAAGAVLLSSQIAKFSGDNRSSAAVLAEATTDFVIEENPSIANQDGNSLSVGSEKAWIGTGQSTSQSYLGMRFTGGNIPAGAQVKSAKIEFTATGAWIPVNVTFYGDTSNGGVFTSANKPSNRALTSSSKNYSDNVNWVANQIYSYDVTDPVKELVGSNGAASVTIIAKGGGSAYGRKSVYGNPATDKAPRLRVTYQTGVTATATATASPRASATARPTVVPFLPSPSVIPTVKPTATPTVQPTATATVAPTATATTRPTTPPGSGGISNTGEILGLVSADLLGTCSQAVHDKYVTTGPDGKTYRTWHAQKDPSGCTFAHEHGDNPGSAAIYSGQPVAFGYAAFKLPEPKDEPHAGFKCFVHNKGTRNDEGTVALHDSYYCFHMGTGGASRFTARFHSMEFHARTSTGALMRVNGMADVGNVGTICDNPRQQRTVQGLGCKIDSGYEIWENVLRITNQGNVVVSAITSTAVFDPITSMDPKDPARTLYSWSPEAMSQIYKFNDDNSDNRGCDREAYSGPLGWYNQGGSQVYYTDAYGNVVNGGPLKQEISTVGMKSVGALSEFGGLIMGYKGSEPQSQFKYRKSACAPGLGLKN